MNIKTRSMCIDTAHDGSVTKLTIEGHTESYFFTEIGLSFFKKMPSFLSEIAKNEEEYDKLFIEFRNKLSKFLYDEIEIENIINNKVLYPTYKTPNPISP